MTTRTLSFSVPSAAESWTTQMAQKFSEEVGKLDPALKVDVLYKDHGGFKQTTALAALQKGELDFSTLSFSDLGRPFFCFVQALFI